MTEDNLKKSLDRARKYGMLDAPDKAEQMRKLDAAGVMDQLHAQSRSAVEHAASWLKGSGHLLDEAAHAEASKAVKMGQRGMLDDLDVNRLMRKAAGSIYPEWEPTTSPRMDIPDHLGGQFNR